MNLISVPGDYGIRFLPRLNDAGAYACVLGAVAHAPDAVSGRHRGSR